MILIPGKWDENHDPTNHLLVHSFILHTIYFLDTPEQEQRQTTTQQMWMAEDSLIVCKGGSYQ